MPSGLTAAEEAKRNLERQAAADARRAAIEEERRQFLAERAEQQRLAAIEARAERERQKAAFQAQKEKELEEMKVKWAAADKHVDMLRREAFKKAGDNVAAWEGRRDSANANCDAADANHARRMKDAWTTKKNRFEAWQRETEAEAYRRAEEVKMQRTVAKQRFAGELDARDDRLATALALAEERRLRMAAEKAALLAERERLAEIREEESWQARLRIIEKNKERVAKVDAECKRKVKQAEVCLEKRIAGIEQKRQSRLVWMPQMSPGVLEDYVPTSVQ